MGAATSTGLASACSGTAKTAMADSDACYLAYKAGEIEEAESICNRGLGRAKCANATEVEGMLYFTLGLCAESHADWRSAKSRYESSLQVRPGNDKVQERLGAVTARIGR
jgi:tetratricopeptide (TPR) repeat protein